MMLEHGDDPLSENPPPLPGTFPLFPRKGSLTSSHLYPWEMKPITIISLMLMSTYLPYIKRFYQTNIANGELWKHKSGYFAAAVIGYVALHTMCGCAPPKRMEPAATLERSYLSDRSVPLENRLVGELAEASGGAGRQFLNDVLRSPVLRRMGCAPETALRCTSSHHGARLSIYLHTNNPLRAARSDLTTSPLHLKL